jgi:hypothetical protein
VSASPEPRSRQCLGSHAILFPQEPFGKGLAPFRPLVCVLAEQHAEAHAGVLRRIGQVAEEMQLPDFHLKGPGRFAPGKPMARRQSRSRSPLRPQICTASNVLAFVVRHGAISAGARCRRSRPASAEDAARHPHAGCHDCNAGRASRHRRRRRQRACCQPSTAGRHDPRKPNPCRRKGRTPLHTTPSNPEPRHLRRGGTEGLVRARAQTGEAVPLP